jgi:energy-coupling factor transport system permease protein
MFNPLMQFFFHTLLGRTIVGYIIMFTIPLLLPAFVLMVVGVRGLRHLFSYEPRQSFIHRLDPRLKIIYPVIIGILSVMLDWKFVFLLLFFTIIPWLLVRTSQERLRITLAIALTPTIELIWSQGLFYTVVNSGVHTQMLFAFPPTLSWLGTPGFTIAGLLYGAQQAVRILVSVSASLILLLTSRPSEIIWAFYKFRMPASVGLAFAVALRFLPQMIERMTVLLQIIQVRGYDLTVPRWWQIYAWPGYIGRVFACIPIVTVPLLISVLRSTSVMAMVADARAYGSHDQRVMLHEHKISRDDYIAISALAILTLIVLLLIVLHIANRQ